MEPEVSFSILQSPKQQKRTPFLFLEEPHSDCATTAVSSPTQGPCSEWSGVTTVMIRNIPTRYTSVSFMDLLVEHEFEKGSFDFFYLPMDFKTGKNVGYGFINFTNALSTIIFVSKFQNRQLKVLTSKKSLSLVPSKRQGLLQNLAIFHNSDLLNSSSCSPFYKPIVLRNGDLVPLDNQLFKLFMNDTRSGYDVTAVKDSTAATPAPQVLAVPSF